MSAELLFAAEVVRFLVGCVVGAVVLDAVSDRIARELWS